MKKINMGSLFLSVLNIEVEEMELKLANILTGPPKNNIRDNEVVNKFLGLNGKKIVCGGTTASIVSRVLNSEIEVDISSMTKEIPPTANIKGIDLVTEGVLTLNKTKEYLSTYLESKDEKSKRELDDTILGIDGAARLCKLLVKECTHVNFYVGKAINLAHQNPELPIDISNKIDIVEDLVYILNQLGKKSEIFYVDYLI